MRNFLAAFLVFLLWSLFALWFHQTQSEKFCDDCATTHYIKQENDNTKPSTTNKVDDKPISTAPKEDSLITHDSFVVLDENNSPIFQFREGFIINSENDNVIIPNSIETFKDSIYNFLNNNQQKEVVIRAKQLTSEVNFGVNRGNQIKNLLTDFGVNPDRVSVETEISEYSYDKESKNYLNGISMLIKDISKDKLSSIENNIANKTLYSYFAQKGFKPDRTLQAYAIELKNYLEKYPNKTVIVTGHTDAVGSAEANEWFGAERAKNVVKYFASQGIDRNKFTTQSKGHTQPIATNATKEGRAKNRRIEIKIQ